MRKPHWEYVKKDLGFRAPKRFENFDSICLQLHCDHKQHHPLVRYEHFAQSLRDFVFMMTHETRAPLEVVAAFSAFESRGEKVYKMARVFGEELSKTPLNIDIDHLADTGGFICVEYPESIRFRFKYKDESTLLYAHGAFVWVCRSGNGPGAADFTIQRDGSQLHSYVLTLSPLYTDDGKFSGQWDVLKIAVSKHDRDLGRAIEAAIYNHIGLERIGHYDHEETQAREHLDYLMKCLVYIGSGDPDLRDRRPNEKPKIQNEKKLRRFYRDHPDHCQIPMVLVGFDFKKPVAFSMDSTVVQGHLRWQPWGPGRAKVKLIWIDEHTRHYGEGAAE